MRRPDVGVATVHRYNRHRYEPYDPGAAKLPPQAEWDEIFAICAKQHVQYWENPAIKQAPWVPDDSGVFKLSPIEEMLSLSVGPAKIVEGWHEVRGAHMTRPCLAHDSPMTRP